MVAVLSFCLQTGKRTQLWRGEGGHGRDEGEGGHEAASDSHQERLCLQMIG